MPQSFFSIALLVVVALLTTLLPSAQANEIVDRKFVEYGDVTEDYPYYYDRYPICSEENENNSKDCLNATEFVLNDFVVADVNLASFRDNPNAISVKPPTTRHQPTTRPFLLYKDFDISDMIKGNETWMELILIRRHLQRPSLTFYSDKVSRKLWLKERGYPQPRLFYAAYADQLVEDYKNQKEELAAKILPQLPTKHGYCAKPNHMVSACCFDGRLCVVVLE